MFDLLMANGCEDKNERLGAAANIILVQCGARPAYMESGFEFEGHYASLINENQELFSNVRVFAVRREHQKIGKMWVQVYFYNPNLMPKEEFEKMEKHTLPRERVAQIGRVLGYRGDMRPDNDRFVRFTVKFNSEYNCNLQETLYGYGYKFGGEGDKELVEEEQRRLQEPLKCLGLQVVAETGRKHRLKMFIRKLYLSCQIRKIKGIVDTVRDPLLDVIRYEQHRAECAVEEAIAKHFYMQKDMLGDLLAQHGFMSMTDYFRSAPGVKVMAIMVARMNHQVVYEIFKKIESDIKTANPFKEEIVITEEQKAANALLEENWLPY